MTFFAQWVRSIISKSPRRENTLRFFGGKQYPRLLWLNKHPTLFDLQLCFFHRGRLSSLEPFSQHFRDMTSSSVSKNSRSFDLLLYCLTSNPLRLFWPSTFQVIGSFIRSTSRVAATVACQMIRGSNKVAVPFKHPNATFYQVLKS